MEKIHHDKCMVCNKKNLSHFLSTRDYFYSQEEFDLFKCEDCGLVLTQDAANEKEIGKYYKSQDYVSHSDTKEGLVNRLYHFSREYMLGRKSRIINKICSKNGNKLLDIGSGTGYFLDHMKRDDWDVTGIEQDADARKFSQETFDLEVFSPEELNTLTPSQFDIITMLHVLEHVLPLNEYLEKISALLKADGRFLVAVPNYCSFDAGYYKKYWAAYDVPRHLWHFSPGAFMTLMDRHNFNIISVKKMPLDSFYISVVSESYRKNKMAIFSGFIIGCISFFISLVNSKKSSSVLYIIEKKQ